MGNPGAFAPGRNFAQASTRTMPIGHDLDLLCQATAWAATRRRGLPVSQRNLQRYMRVGFVKAQRLLLLMDDYGITSGQPPSRWESRTVLVAEEELPGVLADLRQRAATGKERADGR